MGPDNKYLGCDSIKMQSPQVLKSMESLLHCGSKQQAL